MFHRKNAAAILIAMGDTCAYGQDSVIIIKPVITGFANAYYRYSLLDPSAKENDF